jgi:hypothetical protein
MAESDPTRSLLTAARKLAACEHHKTEWLDKRVDEGAGDVVTIELCLRCASYRYRRGGDADLGDIVHPGKWRLSDFAQHVVDAAREADAPAEANAPAACGCLETYPQFHPDAASNPDRVSHGAGCPEHLVGVPLPRARLDAAVARLHAMTELVHALDQVDARAFAMHVEGAASLDEVRATVHARLREAANAFVEASDELYAACEGERAGGEP